ncbi:probable 28S ribosomal protein S23, mitochondrial [Mercenaria mercenaria]|uniref:probable 28S ribosomal protein S23, mitochondrial n=1 Tax=Mercenaria mercenaria TaxID=6596 RepID=UPI00234E5AB4|nr:probable 28S ribosomal protein S23, mitochondrial [Mercenaria mercenaria]
MAGSRVHKYKSIFKRVEGLIKSEALPWKDRPLWYDVMERFPPKVDPDFERPVPKNTVRKILYPEDLIRAKYYEEFNDRDVVNMRTERDDIKIKTQVFVEAYLELREPGMKVDEIIEKVEQKLNSDGTKYIRKKAKVFVEEPKPDFDDVNIELEKTPKSTGAELKFAGRPR